MKKTTLAMAFLAFAALALSMSTLAYDPTGTWDYEVDSPDGAITGEMTISKEEEGFSVSIETEQFGTLELDDVELEEASMTGNVEVEGLLADFEMDFDGDSMEGVIYYGEAELPLSAERQK